MVRPTPPHARPGPTPGLPPLTPRPTPGPAQRPAYPPPHRHRTGDGWELGAYDGTYIAQTRDVIIVTHNYRLGPFGYLVTPDGRGNYGFEDQRLALQWVIANIAAFGGDPNQITMCVWIRTVIRVRIRAGFRAGIGRGSCGARGKRGRERRWKERRVRGPQPLTCSHQRPNDLLPSTPQ